MVPPLRLSCDPAEVIKASAADLPLFAAGSGSSERGPKERPNDCVFIKRLAVPAAVCTLHGTGRAQSAVFSSPSFFLVHTSWLRVPVNSFSSGQEMTSGYFSNSEQQEQTPGRVVRVVRLPERERF